MLRRPLGILVCGEPPPEVASRFGPFVDWFAELLRDRPVRIVAIDGAAPRLPAAGEFAGLIITGSPASVTAPEPWMSGVAELIHGARAAGTPVLGVCFGHQLIAFAAGGEVVENPSGWEMGTYPVALLPAAEKVPLFKGIESTEGLSAATEGHLTEGLSAATEGHSTEGLSAATEGRWFPANFSHRDAVAPAALPDTVTVLAKNERTDVQALAFGEATLGVQFHPEFSAPITRAYIEVRADDLAADAERREAPADMPDQLLARVQDCPASAALVDRFTAEYVLRA